MLGTDERSNKVLCSSKASSSESQSSGSVEEDIWESVDSGTIIDIKGESNSQQASDGRSGCWSRGTWVKILLLFALLSAIIVAFPVLKVHKYFPDLLDWIKANQCKGFFTFVAVYALATVLFVPGALLALGGGFVFHLGLGTLAVWTGATIGQTAAFLLGRYIFRDCISSVTRRYKVWRAIEQVTDDQGWKIVALLRLAPIIPYDALNYAFGFTAIGFWEYFLSSTISIIPGSLLFVYIGSLAGSITEIAKGEATFDSTTFIIAGSVSGVAIVAVVLLGTFYARKALKKMIAEEVEVDSSLEESSQCENPLDSKEDKDFQIQIIEIKKQDTTSR